MQGFVKRVGERAPTPKTLEERIAKLEALWLTAFPVGVVPATVRASSSGMSAQSNSDSLEDVDEEV